MLVMLVGRPAGLLSVLVVTLADCVTDWCELVSPTFRPATKPCHHASLHDEKISSRKIHHTCAALVVPAVWARPKPPSVGLIYSTAIQSFSALLGKVREGTWNRQC